MELVYSKQYFFREKGLTEILSLLEESDASSRRDISSLVRAACEILSKVLKDKVMSVREYVPYIRCLMCLHVYVYLSPGSKFI